MGLVEISRVVIEPPLIEPVEERIRNAVHAVGEASVIGLLVGIGITAAGIILRVFDGRIVVDLIEDPLL